MPAERHVFGRDLGRLEFALLHYLTVGYVFQELNDNKIKNPEYRVSVKPFPAWVFSLNLQYRRPKHTEEKITNHVSCLWYSIDF
jgi:hypothetical protein